MRCVWERVSWYESCTFAERSGDRWSPSAEAERRAAINLDRVTACGDANGVRWIDKTPKTSKLCERVSEGKPVNVRSGYE